MLTIRLISNLIYCKNTKNISYLTLHQNHANNLKNSILFLVRIQFYVINK